MEMMSNSIAFSFRENPNEPANVETIDFINHKDGSLEVIISYEDYGDHRVLGYVLNLAQKADLKKWIMQLDKKEKVLECWENEKT